MPKLQVGPLLIDQESRIATINSEPLSLTVTEFALLEFLSRHPNQVFNANALCDRVKNSSDNSSPDTVRTDIKELGTKLEAAGHSDLLQNIHGVGYKLNVG